MNPRQVRLALTGLALGVLLALVLAPQTRWLVRLQALTVLRQYHPLPSGTCYTGSAAGDRNRSQALAARQPDDYAVQYAAAVAGDGHEQTITALHALATRFPDQTALYANLLRYEMLGKIHLSRPEEEALLNPGLRLDDSRMHYNAPADLAAFDADAAAGERLDPDNAYFPLMRAVGLFAAFRDAEGLDAVKRASQKPSWREYCADEVEARWRLHEEAFGDPGALSRVSIAASLLLPQYQQIRALARLILVKAIQEEQAGHRNEGLELREELRRCGDLMRVQSTYVIGALVAVAICEIATDRTDGLTRPRAASAPASADQQARLRLDAYAADAIRLGSPEYAARARAEFAAGRQVSAIARFDDPARLSQLEQPLVSLTRWWLADIAVLSNVFWLLLFGGLTAGFARTRWARELRGNETPSLSRTTAARRGLVVMSVPVVGFLLADSLMHFFQPPDLLGGILRGVESLFLLLLLFALPPAVAIYLLRHGFRLPPFSWAGLLRGVGAALLLGVALYGLCTLVGWQAGSVANIMDGADTLLNVSGGGDDTDARQASAQRLALAAVSAGPLLLLLVSGIVARVRRVPLSVGLVRGFAAATLPASCLLLLVWGGLLLGTVRQEVAVNAQVWHQVHDEGPYLAAQAGQTWPGPVVSRP